MVFWNRTKIIATIGPASNSRAELAAMLRAGADVIRINGAHGDMDGHKKMIALIREVAKAAGLPTAILFDLPGPKLRLGTLKREPVVLKTGQIVVLACGKSEQTDERIPVPDKIVCRSVKKGSQIFINDGLVGAVVNRVSGTNIECRVRAGGEVRSRKGLNLPRAKLPIPSLTSRDKELLSFAIREDVDYIGLSFVRRAKNMIDLKRMVSKRAPHIRVVAKIEKPEALEDLDRIVDASDVVMLARGDLGIEMPFDEIPLIQKKVLKKCASAGKPTITATQMMESMVSSKMPTRAEATDVAGAVWQGTDAVMLSEETSIGQNPALAVKAMAKVASEAEREMPELMSPEKKRDWKELQAQAISQAAGMLADRLCAKAIVAPTRTGRTALYISRMRPRTQIIALTDNERTARRMNMFWGVTPMTMPTFSTVDEMLSYAEKAALRSRLIKKDDTIVITSSAHGGKGKITSLVEVRRV